jgi:hypothetical protein
MALMKISRVVSTVGFIFLASCSLTQSMELTPNPPTARPTLPPSTLVPTADRDVHTVSTPSPEPSATITLFECLPKDTDVTTNYTVTADMQYVKRDLKVAQEVTYTNTTDTPLSNLDFNIRSNWQAGIFRLQTVELTNGTPLKSHLSSQQLEVTLPQSLNPGCVVRLTIKFDLHIPPIDIGGVHAYQGYLGYTGRQTNLGQWLPVIAARDANGWISHEEIPIGEQDALEVANWDIDLQITGAPGNVEIAAPGTVKQISSTEWHLDLTQSRDFSLSIGENYRLLQQTTNSGVNIELYSFDDSLIPTDNGTMDSAAFALNTAVKSVNLYESLYGSYPLKRLVIVEGDFPDGMEFSGLVFVGGEYFRGLSGVQSYLTIITAHEVAHQWWYAHVGNDQAIDPFLDEALATYSEFVFIEKYYPTLKDWWWDFRVNRLSPQGFVDSTVYVFATRRAYINAVYLRGAKMLNDLRTALGDDVFFGWLNRYAAEGANHLMKPDQFWSLLTPEQLTRTESIRQLYLQKSRILETATPACDPQSTCSPK